MPTRSTKVKQRFRIAKKLVDIFILRRDLYSVQLFNGKGYSCIHEPLKLHKVLDHLRGKITLATYVLSENNKAKYSVLDADGENGLNDLKEIAWILGSEGIKSYLELSRRGGHLWFFFSNQIEGRVARGFGLGIINQFKKEDIEVYPKQHQLGEGPGSSIRLPFGIHRKSNTKYNFITMSGEKLAPTISRQIEILYKAETVKPLSIWKYYEKRPEEQIDIRNCGGQYNKLKKLNLVTFLEDYVDFEIYYSKGALGYCPFHNDVNNPSFAVSNTNPSGDWLWRCFANHGCGGGSIIEFWMKYKKIDYQEAEKQLKILTGVK
jgi:hypothetical protein